MAKPTLDYLAAVTAQKITDVIGKTVNENKKVSSTDVENLATKALGVLQAQGIYAMFLFLLSRSGTATRENKMKPEERVACELVARLWSLRNPLEALRQLEDPSATEELTFEQVNARNGDDDQKRRILERLAQITQDLDVVLLARDLYEQTLIYTRFGAKALSDRPTSEASLSSEERT